MTRSPAAIHEPRWAQSSAGPELTANEVSAVVDAAGFVVGEEAETWVATITAGQEPLTQRSALEWAANYLTGDIGHLQRLWRIEQREKPGQRQQWAAKVERNAMNLLELFGVDGVGAPAEWQAIEAAMVDLTLPNVPAIGPFSFEIEAADALLPFLSKMTPLTTRPEAYGIDFRERTQLWSLPSIVANMQGQESPTPSGPILSDALRMSAIGLQLVALRARQVQAVTRQTRTGKRKASRSLIYFGQQVGSMYQNLSGHEPTVRVDPSTNRTYGPAVTFYQGICRLAVALVATRDADDRKLIAALKRRVANTATAAEDIRSAAKGGMPRKR